MGLIVVVVLAEIGQDGHETAVIDHDQVVQALDANPPCDSLCDRVRVWGPTTSLDSDDDLGSGPFVEVTTVDSVAIVDQMGRLTSPKRRIDQLSPKPVGRWVWRTSWPGGNPCGWKCLVELPNLCR